MKVLFKYCNGIEKDLANFESYDEFKRSDPPISYVKSGNEMEDALRQLIFEHPSIYWDVENIEDADIRILLDWIDVNGWYYAKYFDDCNVYGHYENWDAFVESQAEQWQDEFESGLRDDQKNGLYCCYNFDIDGFSRNLDIDFIIGKYGTVFYRG